MDYTLMLRYLLVVSSACMAMEKSVSITDVLQTSPTTSKNNRRDRRVRHGHVDEEGSLTEAKKTKTCCLNGGLCIMNAFCHCKKNFYGRRCEHQQRHRSCGTISHGTWMAVGCHLCHCFDGQISCKTSIIPDCENMSYAEGRESDPDYNVGFDKKAEDYDRFYDDYEDPAPTSASSAISLQTNGVLVMVAMVTGFLRKSGS